MQQWPICDLLNIFNKLKSIIINSQCIDILDAEFSSWGEWAYVENSICSDSCGNEGTQEKTRTRECLKRSSSGIKECIGEVQEFKRFPCQQQMPPCGGKSIQKVRRFNLLYTLFFLKGTFVVGLKLKFLILFFWRDWAFVFTQILRKDDEESWIIRFFKEIKYNTREKDYVK